MPKATPIPVVNRLIEALPSKDRKRLLGRCENVDLVFGDVLCEPNQPLRHLYFPITGFISLVIRVGEHAPLEMGLIGNEGMLGATLVLGVNEVPLRGVVQGAGTALRVAAPAFRRELRGSPALQLGLNRYLYVLMAQLAQTSACTRFHEVEARLARWLLMTHDRAHADRFHLTHKFLADMLGVRRSGITIAAGALQQRRLIQYTRGEISILDRIGLEGASCECYDAVMKDYARLMVPPKFEPGSVR
ncbi:Crp/Fnr family transcriptional regulator [Panacagrimonas sp.]|uniref:Crp/Fnr family transcriptional regulator n=1 Tax=Panacagrimonas sp. TaxID=2480088 RepID=UPI003B51B443